MTDPAQLTAWQDRLNATPFAAWLGLALEGCDDTGIIMRLRSRPEILGSPSTGALHGGILATLIDTGASYAVMLRTERSVATIDMRVDFHRPGQSSEYRIEGNAIKIGHTVSTGEARVIDSEGKLVASGRAVFMNVER
jgi:uncharacterized protein (TIGR00369 family)